MSDFNFDLLKELSTITIQAYEESKNLKNEISYKELNDIVTSTDKYIDDRIIEFISHKFPEHSIYSEENGENLLLFNIAL
ncbi:MAG: hypothetical protein HFJ12_06585 [Bacilli bacterium]|nr:hypothetical protein [Bacilli bacterium]